MCRPRCCLPRKAAIIASLLMLCGLSACASTTDPTAWRNVHDGFLIGNIYTGDDHI